MTEPQIFGTHEPKTLTQLRDVASRADGAALMADGHLGYIMPIGGVAAYRDRVSVAGVGFDIACTVSFGVGRTNRAKDAPVDDPLFHDPAWAAIPDGAERRALKKKAREQL